MSISSNSRSDVDLLTSIDPHKLNILDKRIRGDGKGGIESTSFSSPPPRSIISPAPPGTSGGSGSGRPRSNSLCVGDNVSNMTTATDADATWVGSDANNNDGESSSSGCDGASSRSSCQTVHHANLMMRNGGGGIVPGEGGGLAINDSGPAIAASESGSTIHQQALSSNLNNKKKSTPSKRPVSAIGDRMTSPPIRTKSSIGANGGHGTKHKTISTTTSTEEGGIATNSNNRAIGVPCSEGAPQLNSAPVAASSAASTSSGSMHATTTATTTMGPETSRSESRDSTLHSYFGSSVLSSSNHATNATSNPPMIRSFHQQQQHLSPPILHSKQPKSGNQRTLHSFLGISDKKLQQQSAEQDEAKNMIASSEGRIGELGMGVAASTNTSRTVTTSSSSISSTSSSSKKMKSSSTHKVSGPTDSTSTQESSEQHQQQESLFREIKRLQAQLSTLQKQLEEANARNNSIKNNQTLISANLQRQLKFVKAELEEVKRESNARQTKSMEVMENFVREESMREAKELRQSLASDGARLGRLLTSRVGSHHGGGMMGGLVRSSQSIETWEDGHAPKMIKLRRSELKAEKERLEKRLEELLRANKNEGHVGPDLGSVSTGLSVQVASDSTLVVGNELSNNSSSGNSAIILSDLDRMEATETVKMHLHEVKKKEVELDSEERALNIEKRAHVRALKLVSNEDSSKFRSRRKVSMVVTRQRRCFQPTISHTLPLILTPSFMIDTS